MYLVHCSLLYIKNKTCTCTCVYTCMWLINLCGGKNWMCNPVQLFLACWLSSAACSTNSIWYHWVYDAKSSCGSWNSSSTDHPEHPGKISTRTQTSNWWACTCVHICTHSLSPTHIHVCEKMQGSLVNIGRYWIDNTAPSVLHWEGGGIYMYMCTCTNIALPGPPCLVLGIPPSHFFHMCM